VETHVETPHDISGGLATHVQKSEKGKENFEKGKRKKESLISWEIRCL